ncbi:hypothetical protein [Tabrizicola flagellatus]|nr:hypothetical protein [Tabrizicola flagellatus]
MTNRIALWLGVILLAGATADLLLNGGAALAFLARRFLDLLDWVVFWA